MLWNEVEGKTLRARDDRVRVGRPLKSARKKKGPGSVVASLMSAAAAAAAAQMPTHQSVAVVEPLGDTAQALLALCAGLHLEAS